MPLLPKVPPLAAELLRTADVSEMRREPGARDTGLQKDQRRPSKVRQLR
jgi:hypothetical protein